MNAVLRVAIAEDEAESRGQLTEFLRQYGETYSVEMEVSCFSSGVDLVQDYRPEYDIILLDIAMPDMDGMETARRIRQVDEQVVLVFITQMAQYAINGYEVGALDFILKPVNYDVFAMKLTKAIRRAESREGKRIVLALPSGVQVLQTRDIYSEPCPALPHQPGRVCPAWDNAEGGAGVGALPFQPVQQLVPGEPGLCISGG